MGEFCQIEIKNHDVKSDAMSKMLASLNKHNVTVGIHRAEGSQVISTSNGKAYTMIENACNQEFGFTQVVEKTRRFKSPYTGKWFYLKKGTKITTPPRIFIRIFSQDKMAQKELTNAFKESIENKELKTAYAIFKNVGDFARLKQKSRILNREVKPKNAKMTVEYKGYNQPLVLSGKMMSAIKSEVH